MKLCKLVLFSFCLLSLSSARLQAQGPVSKFQKVIGGIAADIVHDIKVAPDSGYILVGSTRSFGGAFPGDRDIYVVKTDADGNSKWKKTYGTNASEEAMAVENLDGGGYIIVGNSIDSVTGNSSIAVWHISSTGSLFWEKLYSVFPASYGYAVRPATNGTYIICGKTHNTVNNDNEAYMLCIDANGDVLWCRGYNGSAGYDDAINSVAQTPDGGYLLTGDSYLAATNDHNMLVIKTDSLGDALWINTYASSDNSAAYDGFPLGDGYVIGGQMVDTGAHTRSNLVLLRLDNAGTPSWSRSYGGSSDDFMHGLSIQDNTLVLVGVAKSFSVDATFDAYVLRTDTSGTLLSSATMGDTAQYESAICSAPGPFNTVAIGGTINGAGFGIEDYYFIKTKDNESGCYQQTTGTIVTFLSINSSAFSGTDTLSATYVDAIPQIQTGINELTLCFSTGFPATVNAAAIPQQITLYPNPAEGEFTIDLRADADAYTINILNCVGQDVTDQFTTIAMGEQIKVTTRWRVPGLYLFTLQDANGDRRSTRLLIQ